MPDQRSCCYTCNHPQRKEIDKDLLENVLTLSQISAKYDGNISTKSLSTHGLNHLPGYKRSDYQMQRRRSQSRALTSETPCRSVGKTGGAMVIPRIPSNNITIKDDSIIVSAKVPEYKANTSIDDQILYHKLEITKLEHLKSIGRV